MDNPPPLIYNLPLDVLEVLIGYLNFLDLPNFIRASKRLHVEISLPN
jgi:hypothetical protein